MMVMAEGSLEGFLSDRSTHTLTAYKTKEGTGMYMLTHLHTAFSLRPLWLWHFHESSGDTGAVFTTHQVRDDVSCTDARQPHNLLIGCF